MGPYLAEAAVKENFQVKKKKREDGDWREKRGASQRQAANAKAASIPYPTPKKWDEAH